MLTFGAKLRGIRNMLNMSQAELAKQANLQRRDVIQFENDVYLPSSRAQAAIEKNKRLAENPKAVVVQVTSRG
ncbi:helix-turn-helix transcriptional regulator [Chloroflexota bacterium]